MRKIYYVNGLLIWNGKKWSCGLAPNSCVRRRHATKLCRVSGKKENRYQNTQQCELIEQMSYSQLHYERVKPATSCFVINTLAERVNSFCNKGGFTSVGSCTLHGSQRKQRFCLPGFLIQLLLMGKGDKFEYSWDQYNSSQWKKKATKDTRHFLEDESWCLWLTALAEARDSGAILDLL